MLNKVVISPLNSKKVIAFFDDLHRSKEASKEKFAKSTAAIREKMIKKLPQQN